MKVRILGCSGGIGGPHLRTTSMQVDDDILVDCGTGVGELSVAELARIDHVFLTHSHLDHIACLPLLIDTVIDMRPQPLTVYGTEDTLDAIRRHIFNWEIWPDFSVVPSVEKPFMRFESLSVDDTLLLGSRRVSVLPANHTVPAVGYHLASPDASLVFTGDTGPCPELWERVNRIADLRYLIIETAFPDRDRRLAEVSKHLCPGMLADELKKLRVPVEIYITHLKPGQIELTMNEVVSCTGSRVPRMLQDEQVFDL
jgi:ribonuclease BN (tRNA processing enzyme)